MLNNDQKNRLYNRLLRAVNILYEIQGDGYFDTQEKKNEYFNSLLILQYEHLCKAVEKTVNEHIEAFKKQKQEEESKKTGKKRVIHLLKQQENAQC